MRAKEAKRLTEMANLLENRMAEIYGQIRGAAEAGRYTVALNLEADERKALREKGFSVLAGGGMTQTGRMYDVSWDWEED